MLYEVVKTHEIELIQKRAIRASQGAMVNTSCALVGDLVKEIEAASSWQIKIEKMIEEIEDLLLEDYEKSKDEF